MQDNSTQAAAKSNSDYEAELKSIGEQMYEHSLDLVRLKKELEHVGIYEVPILSVYDENTNNHYRDHEELRGYVLTHER